MVANEQKVAHKSRGKREKLAEEQRRRINLILNDC